MTAPTPTLPSFATVEQYEQATGRSPAPAGAQEQLDAASAAIRRYCGWHIAPSVTADWIVDGPGAALLVLPTLHLTDLSTVSETLGGTTTVLDPATVEWSATGVVRKRNSGYWTSQFRGVRATGTHGYDLVEVLDLVHLTIAVVARAEANPYGFTSQAVGGVSVGMPTGPGGSGGILVYPDQQATLDLYKLEPQP